MEVAFQEILAQKGFADTSTSVGRTERSVNHPSYKIHDFVLHVFVTQPFYL